MHARQNDLLGANERSMRAASIAWDLFRVVGGVVLVGASRLAGDAAPETTLLRWVGAALLFFGLKSWFRRRRKHGDSVLLRDPDQVHRAGMVAIVLVIGVSIILLAEPHRMFAWMSGGIRLASVFDYDPVFRTTRLPWLFATWTIQAVMLAALAIRGRWSPQLRWANLVLSATLALLLIWYRTSGQVMADPRADQSVKAYMDLIAAFLIVDLAVRLHVHALRLGDRSTEPTPRTE